VHLLVAAVIIAAVVAGACALRWQNEHQNRVYRSDDRDGRH
jgi:hypothetical protein